MNSQEEYQRVSLRGLHGVHVLVADLDTEDDEISELDTAQIWKDINDMLRTAGINVLTREEAMRTPGIPCLYVNVDTMKGSDGFYAYSTTVELLQGVYLIRNPDIRTYAETWSSGVKGIAAEPNLKKTIQDDLRDILEVFINNYFSVNQKV
jgi:hypothetical protein